MIRTAVLFDMDGLMVDTEPLARRAWERVVAPYGATMTDDLYDRMLGRRTIESAQLVLDELGLPVSLETLVERKTAEFLSRLDDGVPVMPGLFALLDEVERRGLPWAVATSTPRDVAEIKSTPRFRELHAGIRPAFDDVAVPVDVEPVEHRVGDDATDALDGCELVAGRGADCVERLGRHEGIPEPGEE